MAPPVAFPSALAASSYHAPGGGELYAPLREKVIATAVAMGYDRETMVEYGVNWSDDHDPFGHVKNHAYPSLMTMCNMRVIFSFEPYLKEKYADFMNAKTIGCLVKSTTLDLKRPVTFPDSLIIANRLTEVLVDRYFGVTTIWSLRQQAIVAETRGYMVFFDYNNNIPADMIKAGGVYTDLYNALVARKEQGDKIAAKWEAEHPPKKRKAKL
ncbi:hypothetical protein O988_02917 [Pseudogymnoascus sp. VKM F-3808]|nr:hypothetical protein O988_02917 [Pseudogymnoascus sp. VKM F-3808]